MAMRGLAGSVLALRSLECLEAEEAVQAIRQASALASASMLGRQMGEGAGGFHTTSGTEVSEL